VIVEPRELIVVRGLRFTSRCEAHELPVIGVAHVGYVPDAILLDLDDLADAIERCSVGPQRQERLTAAVADWMAAALDPLGVAVVLEADHACYAGASTGGRAANVVTARYRGLLRENAGMRAEFVARCVRR
jgi:GTP cyclohydrolase I